nr:hypothetical protein [Tanacetum cinerariifolium]
MHQVSLIQYHRLELHHLESSLDSSFERSLDSSSPSAEPSRKRCRSLTTLVPPSTPVSRSITPTHADLLPPHKRLRDSYSPEDSREEHMEIGMGVEIPASDIKEDEEEFETAQRQLEAGQLMASEERAGLTDRIRRLGNLPIEELIAQRVVEALANYEATHAANALETKNQSQNGSDNDIGNGGNGDRGNKGNGNLIENGRGAMPVARVCTYQDFVKCQPLNFKGSEGVFGLTRWFKKMETVFYISNCPEVYQVKMVPGEKDRIKRYVRGLPDNIQRNVMSAEPTRPQDAIRLANSLMDQKLKGYAIRSNENKRKFERNQRDNRAQHLQFKRKNVGGSNVARAYTSSVNQRAPVVNQRSVTCFECGRKGNSKKDCPKLKNQNHGNKPVIPEARGKAYAIGGGDAYPGSNVVTCTFLLKNYYAFVFFDSGADQSFVSTTFSTLLDIIPDALDVSYVVELADGRIAETNTVLRGCTIGLLGHPFNFDLMPVELVSFDVIIGMDWLAKSCGDRL